MCIAFKAVSLYDYKVSYWSSWYKARRKVYIRSDSAQNALDAVKDGLGVGVYRDFKVYRVNSRTS